MGNEKEGLWKQVILSKYNVSREGWIAEDPTPRFSGLWKGILEAKEYFSKQVRYRVGKADKILFWTNLWLGDTSLAATFPELFSCASD